MPDILIADDHTAVRHGLALLTRKALNEPCQIDFAQSGEEVLDALQQKPYAMLLTDLLLPEQQGVSLIGKALAIQPGLKIIIVSVDLDRDLAPQCLHSGACAYINKAASDHNFIKSIRSVAYSDYYAHKKKVAARGLNNKRKERKPFDLLSIREHEVMLLLLRGLSIMEIAHTLSLSQSTVSTLKARAFTKLNVQSVIELSRLAYFQGLYLDGAIS